MRILDIPVPLLPQRLALLFGELDFLAVVDDADAALGLR
jgi:hypothetical protein